MKSKKSKVIVTLLIIIAIIGLGGFILLNNVKNTANSITISNVDLSQKKDGTYNGQCEVNPVYVETETTIKDNKITDIKIIKHQQGLGKKAEDIINTIKDNQSLQVDTVSGATVSSKCILKSIESSLK